jgi:hypothetical protein
MGDPADAEPPGRKTQCPQRRVMHVCKRLHRCRGLFLQLHRNGWPAGRHRVCAGRALERHYLVDRAHPKCHRIWRQRAQRCVLQLANCLYCCRRLLKQGARRALGWQQLVDPATSRPRGPARGITLRSVVHIAGRLHRCRLLLGVWGRSEQELALSGSPSVQPGADLPQQKTLVAQPPCFGDALRPLAPWARPHCKIRERAPPNHRWQPSHAAG